ncbi:hypothetical protein F4803DRAFT_553390 [Xylaria telfairii]|nr:hypothetical protein F4803DRAFT_553390 [Xylaria telfairii]
MTSLRGGLLEEEKRRREKHLAPIDKTKFGRSQVVKEVQQHIIEELQEQKKLPLVSASYFNWRVDRHIWECFGDKKADPEFPPPPPLYAPPYSTLYAKAYFAANPSEEEKDKGKGKGREEPETRVDGSDLGVARASTQVVDPADEAVGEVVGVVAWYPTGEKSSRALLKDKLRLHRDLLGKTIAYQEGCGPFQIEFPFSALGDEIETCLGPREGLVDLLAEASKFMGGSHGVMLFAKFRDLPNGDRRASLFLDWHDMAPIDTVAWQRVLYKAWCALLNLFNSQLRGVRVGLMDHLRQYYGESMREHLMLYSRIGAAVHHLQCQADARRNAAVAEGVEIDEEEGEALFAKVDKFAKQKANALVGQYVKAKPNLTEQIKELVRLVNSPTALPQFGNTRETRLALIRPTAEKILTDQIRYVLEDPDVPLDLPGRLEQCISCLQDPKAPWNQLLSPFTRRRIISAGIWDYKEAHGEDEEGWVDRTLVLLDTSGAVVPGIEALIPEAMDEM